MPQKPLAVIEEHFSKVTDPRKDRTKDHKLIDIIVIAICAVICGAEGWTDIENFGNCNLSWLKTFLELPNGIPSHDTFGRVFSMLDGQGNKDDVVRALGVHPFVAEKATGQSAHFSVETLEAIYHRLLRIDEGVKTGQVTLDLALDTLVVELTR